MLRIQFEKHFTMLLTTTSFHCFTLFFSPQVSMTGEVAFPSSQLNREAACRRGDGQVIYIGKALPPFDKLKVAPEGEIAQTEIFGPVLSVMRASTVDEAIQLVNNRAFGNMACIFTSSGATARQFRYEADAGNVGINIGVAAPMAHGRAQGEKVGFFKTYFQSAHVA